MAETATEVVTPAIAPIAPIAPTPGDGIADPGPLGLAGFAMTTFVLSVFNANIIKSPVSAVVLPLALFYGGGVQLLAGMWEFRKGNTFGALAFSSFGAFWLSAFFYLRYIAGTLPAATAYEATGLFFLAWAIFTAYMLIASLRTTVAVVAVFATLTVTFTLLTIGTLGKHMAIAHAGGWAGLVTALCAWYASFAGVTNATWGKNVIPVGRLS